MISFLDHRRVNSAHEAFPTSSTYNLHMEHTYVRLRHKATAGPVFVRKKNRLLSCLLIAREVELQKQLIRPRLELETFSELTEC